MVNTISFKIRIPRVIVLMLFDRMPKKEVKFTRHNIFERDKNTCQDREGFRPARPEPRSRCPARQRRADHVGEYRLLLHPV